MTLLAEPVLHAEITMYYVSAVDFVDIALAELARAAYFRILIHSSMRWSLIAPPPD